MSTYASIPLPPDQFLSYGDGGPVDIAVNYVPGPDDEIRVCVHDERVYLGIEQAVAMRDALTQAITEAFAWRRA